jgi:BNR repeat-containing family member
MRFHSGSGLLLLVFLISLKFSVAKQETPTYSSQPVAWVPASFPVRFALFTAREFQYIAFYDSLHRMTIAARNPDSTHWQFQILDSKVAWDSHNYLSLAVDKQGIIHLVGNMHSSPLIYFRSSKPWDIRTMQALNKMTAKEEDVTTYPEFIYNDKGDLVFHYRYGVSGSGYEVYNIWNSGEQQWHRLLNSALSDGLGEMNAYMQGPIQGPDGVYHLLWVWRDTPDCATNHTLSYARSKDLVNWQSIDGKKVDLPITIKNKELYVDTTPIHGGLINIGIKIGFDAQGNVLAGYHKYDAQGNTQLFVARFEKDSWKMYQVTHWDYRWDFKGFGTIRNDLLLEAPKPLKNANEIVFGYHHIKYGDGQVILDNTTLKPLRTESYVSEYPDAINKIRSKVDDMQVNKVFDKGQTSKTKKFLLRWETLKPNRDQKPSQVDLPAALLEIIEY